MITVFAYFGIAVAFILGLILLYLLHDFMWNFSWYVEMINWIVLPYWFIRVQILDAKPAYYAYRWSLNKGWPARLCGEAALERCYYLTGSCEDPEY